MREKQIKESLKLTYPRIPPYANLTNYNQSLQALHQVSSSNYGSMFDADPYLLLSATKRAFRQTEEELKDKRKFKDKEKVKLNHQWNDLQKLEESLRENFVALSNFLRTNDLKKTRAKKQFEIDVKLIEKRDKDIDHFNRHISFLKESKSVFDKEISRHILYENYLSSVVEESGEFSAVSSIIDRYESLIKTKIALGDRQNYTFSVLEKAKITLSRMTDENNFKLLGMGNILSNLQERYQTIRSRSLGWEKLVHTIKNTALRKYTEINEVRQSCRNIYVLMCRRKGEEPKISDANFEGQLMYIKKTLRQLETAKTQALKGANRIVSSVKVETSKDS